MTTHAAYSASATFRALNLIGVPGVQPVLFLLLGVLIVAAYFDLRSRRIPNWLSFPAALLAVALHGVAGGRAGLLASALAFVLWFLIGFFLYVVVLSYGIGAGDLKLLAASAAFLGIMPALYLALLSFIAHVLWMMGEWFAKGVAGVNFTALLRWLVYLFTPRAPRTHFIPIGTSERSPHAPFILLAALAFYPLWHFGVLVP